MNNLAMNQAFQTSNEISDLFRIEKGLVDVPEINKVLREEIDKKDQPQSVEVNQLWSYKNLLFKVITSENDTVKAVANEGFTWEGIKGTFIANFTFEAEHYSQ